METVGKDPPPGVPGVFHIAYPALLVATVLHLILFPCGVRTTTKACPGRVRRESSFGRFPGPGVLEHLRRGDRSLGRPAWDGGESAKAWLGQAWSSVK